jgi:hypothetical protein
VKNYDFMPKNKNKNSRPIIGRGAHPETIHCFDIENLRKGSFI